MILTPSGWELNFAAAYVVEPGRTHAPNEIQHLVRGSPTDVAALSSEYFHPLFDQSGIAYPIDIAFTTENGEQEHVVRSLIRKMAFPSAPDDAEAASRELAHRLSQATRAISKQGLFVTVVGYYGSGPARKSRVALWKFPSDVSLQADLNCAEIALQVKEAFSGGSTFVKAAMFEGTAATTSFWRGRAEDRQMRGATVGAAEFWIDEFLAAKLSMTGPEGTKLLARALRALTQSTGVSLETKDRVIAAAVVAQNLVGQTVTFRAFADQYLPAEAQPAFVKSIGGEAMADQVFPVDAPVLTRELALKTIVLDGEFVVRGPLARFDDVVQIAREERDPSARDGADKTVTVTLRGEITAETVQKGRVQKQVSRA